MQEPELALRRSQMGRSALSFVTRGPQGVGAQGPGYWVALSGAPSPDANMALADTSEAAAVAAALSIVEQEGYPTLFMLAGDARAAVLGPSWRHVGEMPFMTVSLKGDAQGIDPRVRRAGPDDAEAFAGLLGGAFALSQQVAELMAMLVFLDDLEATIWLLVDHSVAVSAVLTSVVDDAVCLWCMATPPPFARRGYARALLADVLCRAGKQGASVGLLGATPAGRPLYEATGWTALENWKIFTNADSAQFAE